MHNNENEYKKISDLVLARIDTDRAVPTSKAYFVLRNVLMWSLALFSLIFGAFSISGILFRVSNIVHILPPPLQLSHVFDMFRLFPLFWMLVFGLFVYVAYLEVRNTRQGYKYHLSKIVGAMFIMSTLLGIFLYYLGVGFILDKMAARFIPFNPDIETVQRERWLSPETGFLVGEVEEANDKKEVFILRDPDNVEWEVLFSAALSEEEKDIVREGRKIGIKGLVSKEDDHLFIACEIVSVEIQGRGRFILPVASSRDRLQRRLEKEMGERNLSELRINVCEGVRPQQEIIPVN